MRIINKRGQYPFKLIPLVTLPFSADFKFLRGLATVGFLAVDFVSFLVVLSDSAGFWVRAEEVTLFRVLVVQLSFPNLEWIAAAASEPRKEPEARVWAGGLGRSGRNSGLIGTYFVGRFLLQSEAVGLAFDAVEPVFLAAKVFEEDVDDGVGNDDVTAQLLLLFGTETFMLILLF